MDTLTPAERSARMRLVRGKHSKPELAVRSALHGLGFRFRLHRHDLPGKPDIVLPGRRAAIFVHGCFWHRHKDPQCPLARLPKSRLDFWVPKLEGNRVRDAHKLAELERAGWKALVVWECELRHREQVENKLLQFLDAGGAGARY